MDSTSRRVETFAVIDGDLVRQVVPVRGTPYEHRCPLDVYRELAWAAIDLAADGFTVETLADQVRNRPRDEGNVRDTGDNGVDRGDVNAPGVGAPTVPWASYTNAAVAIAFWKDRDLLDIRRRRSYVDDDGFFFEDAMIEFHALAKNG